MCILKIKKELKRLWVIVFSLLLSSFANMCETAPWIYLQVQLSGSLAASLLLPK
jgi:hypothetical protein